MNYLFDASIFVLLIMTILFCWRLNSKLMELKKSRQDIYKLVRVFDESIIRTNQSMNGLKESSARASEKLEKNYYKTHELINEISFATDTSYKVLQKLEGAISHASNIKKELENMTEDASRKRHNVSYTKIKKQAQKKAKYS